MQGQELHEAEQRIREECVPCAGSIHMGAGGLQCARQDQEREFLALRKPLDDAQAALAAFLKEKPEDTTDSKTSLEKAVKKAQADFDQQRGEMQLMHADGTPERFGAEVKRECPVLIAWDLLPKGNKEDPAILTVRQLVQAWRAARKIQPIGPQAG